MDAKRFTPVADLLLLKHEPETMRGKLHLPANVKAVTLPIATVLAVGPKVERARVGQQVLFSHRDARFLDGQVCLCKDEHVVATVEPQLIESVA